MKLLRAVTTVALVAAAATPAYAAPVSFYTTGIFSQSGMNVASFGSLTLTFTGVGAMGSPVTVDPAPFSFTSFGQIAASTSVSSLNPTSGTFTLNIFQTAPTGGSGSLVGTLNGSIDVNTSTSMVTVSTNSLTIGGVTYAYQNSSFALVPPSTNNGVTTLQGVVTAQSTVPEPSTYALLGTGLAGLLSVARRRRTQV